MNPGKIVALIIAASIGTYGGSAIAATLYVTQNTSNHGTECTKKQPCATINEALVHANRGTRIVVAPGYYEEQIVIEHDNMRIESVTGAATTELASQTGPVITVTHNNFKLGKKGKGLSIQSHYTEPGNDVFGLVANGVDKITIEGNQFYGMDYSAPYTETEWAVQLNDVGKALIRDNHFVWFEGGIHVNAGGFKTALNITSNSFERIQNHCIFIENGGSSKDAITKNNFNRCRQNDDSRAGEFAGVHVSTGPESKTKIMDNRIQFTPRAIVISNGTPTIQRNLHLAGDTGIRLEDTSKAVIKDNILRYTNTGIWTGDFVVDTTVTGNHMNSGVLFHHERLETTSYKNVSKNNFSKRGDTCPIVTADTDYSMGPIVFSKNLWSGLSSGGGSWEPNFSETDCTGSNAVTALGNGEILFENPVEDAYTERFKDTLPY